jgi:hypothetical protein
MDNRANPSGKRIVVLGDRQILAEAITLTLRKLLKVEIVERTADALVHQEKVKDLDLIVLASSSPVTEPPQAIARASLGDALGCVSLLVICDRPFDADPEQEIYHLDFPFRHEQLCDKVREILNGNGKAHNRETTRLTTPARAPADITEPEGHEETRQ